MGKGGYKGDSKGHNANHGRGKNAPKDSGGFSHSKHTKVTSELPHELEGVSRELGKLLRHRGLEQMRADGYAPLSAINAALKSQVSSSQIEAVILLSQKDGAARFELLDENGMKWVRACEKHSLPGLGKGAGGNLGKGKSDSAHTPAKGANRGNPSLVGTCAVEQNEERKVSDLSWPAHATQQESQAHAESLSVESGDVVGYARCDFDASEWGDEYISFREGEQLTLCRGEPEDGWAYGKTNLAAGWFPPNAWAPQSEKQQDVEPEPMPQECEDAARFEVSAASNDGQLAMQLQAAQAEIARLRSELAAERQISAKLRQDLDSAQKSRAIPNHLHQGEDNHTFPDLREAAVPKRMPVDRGQTSKQRLISHLAIAFPDVKNEGITYSVVESRKDAKGHSQWRVRIEFKELGSSIEGDTCSSKEGAEQAAALALLTDLGGEL